MKSKTALFKFFKDKYGKDVTLKNVSNETYGKLSFIYIYDVQHLLGVSRDQLIKDLVVEGFPRPGKWGDHENGNGGGAEIQVSYFRGYHWNE